MHGVVVGIKIRIISAGGEGWDAAAHSRRSLTQQAGREQRQGQRRNESFHHSNLLDSNCFVTRVRVSRAALIADWAAVGVWSAGAKWQLPGSYLPQPDVGRRVE